MSNDIQKLLKLFSGTAVFKFIFKQFAASSSSAVVFSKPPDLYLIYSGPAVFKSAIFRGTSSLLYSQKRSNHQVHQQIYH